ncbi:MAG: GNAT family N-acetyltransferase, partial [Clostridia bacterium]|nr:GNAT family N-acetyltransferase [Clostridia bacterium]
GNINTIRHSAAEFTIVLRFLIAELDHTRSDDDAALRVILADDDQPVFCVRDGENLLATAYLQIRRVEENSVLRRRLTVYVDDFCVSSESRGLHVGTRLMEHVIAYAREIGADNVLLNVYEFNTAAIRFYESLGMTTESRHMELAL